MEDKKPRKPTVSKEMKKAMFEMSKKAVVKSLNRVKEKKIFEIAVAWDLSTNQPCSYKPLTIGEKVTINENAKVLLGFDDGLEFTVVDMLQEDVEKPIVLNCKDFGKDWVEFFSVDEIIIL